MVRLRENTINMKPQIKY
jgi:hypothetical protein